ncbi:hypothetical protein [Serratia sp. M24T3]|uniref:hypothetical protein n=1 Tax=Serratia sp. M24T3 TaxID=932213 RepID=UPI0012F49E19|nr:hypothetical protein [Serratia sp. M24T3]
MGTLYTPTEQELAEQRTRELLQTFNPDPSYSNETQSLGSMPPSSRLSQRSSSAGSEEDDMTHSAPLPHYGLRGFFRKHLPMGLMNNRLVKHFTKLQFRPKVPNENRYRSSGDFKIKSISAADASTLSDAYAQMAIDYKSKLSGMLNNDAISDNLEQSININEYIKKIADLYKQPNQQRASAHFYMLKKKKNNDPFAIAMLTHLNGVMTVRGISVHPTALLARLDSSKREEIKQQFGITIGKYDAKGLGTSLSLLAAIASSRKDNTIHSVSTNAVNPLSAKIFSRSMGDIT